MQNQWHITLQVTDVLRLRRRALRSKGQQPQNVVELNRTKGKARLRFCVARTARTGRWAVTVCYVPFILFHKYRLQNSSHSFLKRKG